VAVGSDFVFVDGFSRRLKDAERGAVLIKARNVCPKNTIYWT